MVLYFLPAWRDQATFAVVAFCDVRFIEVRAIPEFASHLLVHLIQAFAVVREIAAANLIALAGSDLQRPVGIGQRGARHRDDVGIAATQRRFAPFTSSD